MSLDQVKRKPPANINIAFIRCSMPAPMLNFFRYPNDIGESAIRSSLSLLSIKIPV